MKDAIVFFLILFAAYFLSMLAIRALLPAYSSSQITKCASLPEWCAEEMPDLHEVVEAIREKQE